MDLNINVNVTLALDPRSAGMVADVIRPLGALIMGLSDQLQKIEDGLGTLGQHVTDEVNRVNTSVADKQATIDGLKAQLDALQAQGDNLTPEQQTKVDGIIARIAQLQEQVDAINPANPATLPADATGGTPAPDATSATGTTDDPAARFSPAPDATS